MGGASGGGSAAGSAAAGDGASAARAVALALASCVGIASVMQSAINSRLGGQLGHPVWGAAACYGVGMSFVWGGAQLHARAHGLPVMVFAREQPRWFELCGGLAGALYMLIAMTCVQALGVELFFSLVVVGQLTSSLLIDHTGFLGMPLNRATPHKVASLAVALVGVYASASAEEEGGPPAELVAAVGGEGGPVAAGGAPHISHSLRVAYCVLVMFGGLLQPLQSVLNWRLSRLLPHKLQAVTVSFTVAGFVAAIAGLFVFGAGTITASEIVANALTRTRWWQWCGAACNMGVLTGGVYLPARITTSLYYMLLLLGELFASLLFDHIGAFGLPQRAASPQRLVGITLVCAGAALMQTPPGSVRAAVLAVLPPRQRAAVAAWMAAALPGGSVALGLRKALAAWGSPRKGANGGGGGGSGRTHAYGGGVNGDSDVESSNSASSTPLVAPLAEPAQLPQLRAAPSLSLGAASCGAIGGGDVTGSSGSSPLPVSSPSAARSDGGADATTTPLRMAAAADMAAAAASSSSSASSGSTTGGLHHRHHALAAAEDGSGGIRGGSRSPTGGAASAASPPTGGQAHLSPRDGAPLLGAASARRSPRRGGAADDDATVTDGGGGGGGFFSSFFSPSSGGAVSRSGAGSGRGRVVRQ
jgi:bacterial/archaeal transporter family-2 protein